VKRAGAEKMNDMTIELLEEKLHQAMLTSDVYALDQLIADDLAFTTPNGAVINKQMDIESHRSGQTKFTSIEIQEQQAHDYGACVVVMVRAELSGIFDEQAFSGIYCYTRVWMKHQEQWQVIAGHASLVAQA
jgi:ketosteroid isomerase-like protein